MNSMKTLGQQRHNQRGDKENRTNLLKHRSIIALKLSRNTLDGLPMVSAKVAKNLLRLNPKIGDHFLKYII